MGWRWMRLTGRWSISRGRYEAACSPADGGLQGPPPRHTHTLKPQKGLTLNHVPLESLSSPSWLSPTSLSAGTQVG